LTEVASSASAQDGTKPSLGRKTQLDAFLWPSRRYSTFAGKRIPQQASISDGATAGDAFVGGLAASGSITELPSALFYLTDANGNRLVDESGNFITVTFTEAIDQTNGIVTTASTAVISEPASAVDSDSATQITSRSVTEAGTANDLATVLQTAIAAVGESAGANDVQSTQTNFVSAAAEPATASDSSFATTQTPSFVSMVEGASALDTSSWTAFNLVSQSDSVSASDLLSALVLAAGVLVEAGTALDVEAAGLFGTVAEPASASDLLTATPVRSGVLAEIATALDLVQPTASMGLSQLDSASATDLFIAGIGYVAVSVVESAVAQDQQNSFLGPSEKPILSLQGKMARQIGLDGKMDHGVNLSGESPFP